MARIGIAGAKEAAGSQGRAEEITGMAGRSVLLRDIGQMKKYMEAGESGVLLEKGVTNMESKKPQMTSVMVDWRNPPVYMSCIYVCIYVLIRMLVLKLPKSMPCVQEVHTEVFRSKGFMAKMDQMSQMDQKNMVCIQHICGAVEREKSKGNDDKWGIELKKIGEFTMPLLQLFCIVEIVSKYKVFKNNFQRYQKYK